MECTSLVPERAVCAVRSSASHLTVAVAVAVAAASCISPAPTPPTPPSLTAPDLACPGGPSCSATLADDVLLAAAASRVVTPAGFEIANAAYLRTDRPGYCAPEAPRQLPPLGDGATRCGELKDEHLDDCGRDGVCPGAEGYSGPDADGSERDGDDTDWFFDCGLDRICPGNVPEEGELALNGLDDDGDGAVDDGDYPGPDEGEGDGEFQGLWIAGYGNNRPALGVKDDIEVRALVLRQGDTTLAIVSVDAVGLFYDEQVKMQAKLEALRPGAVDVLLLQASHTHEAPDTMGQWGYVDPFVGLQFGHGRSDALMESIRSRGADAVAEALDALVAVEVRVSEVNVGVEGLVRDSRDPFIVNDTVTAISFEDAATGAVVATAVAWGNHPESLDSRNNFISSDYLHATRRALEEGLPETATRPARPARGGTAIYLQGAVGGLLGPNGFEIVGRDGTRYPNDAKTWARTDAYGELIAEHAFTALDDAELLPAPRLRFSTRSYEARVDNVIFHVGIFNRWFDREVYDFDASGEIGGDNVPHLKTAVALVYLGDIGMLTAPGELFPESFVGTGVENAHGRPLVKPTNPNPPDLTQAPKGPTLRDKLAARFALPLGLCQDEVGYLVPSYDFKLGDPAYLEEAAGDHYEETNSIGPQALPLMLEHLDVLFAFEAARAD